MEIVDTTDQFRWATWQSFGPLLSSCRFCSRPLSPGEPTADEFDTMMGWVQKQFTVIPLSEAVQRLADSALPPAAAAITFDDGYRDNLEVAAPILMRRGLPATLFVATGFLDGGIMFNDMVIEAFRRTSLPAIELPEIGIGPLALGSLEERRHAISVVLPAIKYLPASRRNEVVSSLVAKAQVELPRDLMMTSAQLQEFSGLGFEIGAHTESHPILSVLPVEEARREILRSRHVLESLIDKKVGMFAYPNGRWGKDFDQRHRDMVKTEDSMRLSVLNPVYARLAQTFGTCRALRRGMNWHTFFTADVG